MTAAQRALDAWNALDSKDGIGAALHVGQMLADALTAEVRPRGTVTEYAVEIVWRQLELDDVGHLTRGNVRAALEAAREVHP